MTPLAQTARIAAEMRARLAEEYDLSEDDEVLDDTIMGELGLDDQVAALARAAARADAYAEGLAGLIKDNQARKARLEAKSDKLRAMITWAMQEAGYKKIPLPDMTLSLSAGRKPVVIDDGAELPERFLRRPEPQIDKIAIRKALEQGEELPFARWGNPHPTLTIRKG